MPLFESVVPDLQQRTSRGQEVQRLLDALLLEITDPAHGGLAGFLGHFTAAGFSVLVQSWLAHDPYAIASAAQVRYALGDMLLMRLAREADLSTGTAAMLLASMIPRVVYRLTPDGRVPSVRELDDLVTGRSALTTSAPPIHVEQHGVAAATTRSGSWWRDRLRTPVFYYGASIVWLLLIGLAAWWSLRGEANPPATLVLRHAENGLITVSGVVPDAATRELVVGELRRALPASDWGADFAIDPATARPSWLAGLKSLLPLVRTTTGAEIRLAGDRIAVGGALSETQRTRLREQMTAIFGRPVTDLANGATDRD